MQVLFSTTAAGIASVSESLIQFVERMFIGPVWPASVLVCLLILYAIVALLGLVDLDGPTAPDVDMPSDMLGGAGAATLRWLNLQRLPLVVWLTIFTIAFWGVSYVLWYGFDSHRYNPTLWPSLLLVMRNGVIAIVATKVLTGPLNRAFEPAPSYDPSNLIGRTCVVSTTQVTAAAGQAKFPTDAAPLLLNIRTDEAPIPKGTTVRIIAFDHERRLYKVASATAEDSP